MKQYVLGVTTAALAFTLGLGASSQPPSKAPTDEAARLQLSLYYQIRKQRLEAAERFPMATASAVADGWVFVVCSDGRGFIVERSGAVIPAQALGGIPDIEGTQRVAKRTFNFRLGMSEPLATDWLEGFGSDSK